MRKIITRVLPGEARLLSGPLGRTVLAAVVQGAGFALLAAFLGAVLRGRLDTAGWWLAAMALAVALAAALQYRAQLSCYAAGERLAALLYERLSAHLVRLPLGWFGRGRAGEASRLMSKGVIDLMAVPAHLLRPIVGAFATPAAVLGCMLLYDWRVGALAGLAALPLWGAYRLAGSLAARAARAAHEAGAEANERVLEFARLQGMLRAYDRSGGDPDDPAAGESLGQAPLRAALASQHAATRRLLRTGVTGLILFALALQVFFSAVLGQGFWLLARGGLELPVLAALVVLAARFAEPMALAADHGAAVRVAGNTLRRMAEILAEPPLPEPERPLPPGPEPDVVFEGVRFAYPGGAGPVLAEVGFHAAARRVTALVGPSGAGKSTAIHLAARFWDVDRGRVRVAGRDVRAMATETLMAQCALVFQRVYLLEGSIEENIRLGNPRATDEEFRRAVRLARVDAMLPRLPDGLGTRVGEAGALLSGGERQRIALARALLKPAPILLLDEATAALDPANQQAVSNALEALRGQRTVVVIAHRLSTIAGADHIVVLNRRGRVDDAGTHAELLARGGLYAELWRQRAEAQGWRL
jgi:ATP-binding cassette subfamily B protein